MDFSVGGEICLPLPVFGMITTGMATIITALWRSRENAIKRQDDRYDRLLDNAERRLGIGMDERS